MKLSNPFSYKIRLNKNQYEITGKDSQEKFVAPVSSSKIPKLYTVSRNGKLHYVGITSQPISARLRYGLTASGSRGYYGYKWKDKCAQFTLTVWVLEGASAATAYQELETIEAEVVYLCRHKTGHWPISQNEIHFHPSKKSHRIWAAEILRQSLLAG